MVSTTRLGSSSGEEVAGMSADLPGPLRDISQLGTHSRCFGANKQSHSARFARVTSPMGVEKGSHLPLNNANHLHLG